MGNDGGSIPKRRELVKEAARTQTTTELKESQHEQQEYFWTTDPLSQKPLSKPIVSDSSGKLYNKESIIEFLLPSEDIGSKVEAEKILLGGVKSLKDVVEVKFAVEEVIQGNETWVCPVTNKTLGPGSKAVYLVPCGHAFDASVVKEITEQKCLECDEAYAENDVIPILPTSETEIARLSLRMKTLREKGLTHSLKKAAKDKKRKKNGDATENAVATKEADGEAPELVPAKAAPSRSSNSTPANGGIKNAATASLTQKVLEEQEQIKKRRKLQKNENLDALFSSRDQTKPHGKSSDFMTRGFSIPTNAKR